MGFYYNPAILGHSAEENHAAFSFMPTKTKWFSFPAYQSSYKNIGFNFGYNLSEAKLNLPISIGFGYINSDFSYGEFIITSEFGPEPIDTYESYDKFNCFSLGIGLDFVIDFSVGLSLKSYESVLGASILSENNDPIKVEGKMWDFGFLTVVPLSDLFFNDYEVPVNNNFKISPITNLSIGYSLSNYGDEFHYLDESQKDPLSRTARLGFSINFGLDALINNSIINFINYFFTSETHDILIKSDIGNFEYQSLIGDINIFDNIIKLNSNENVIVHKGHIFSIFETITIASGRFYGHGYSTTNETSGIGFSTQGIFKLFKYLPNNEIFAFFINHVHFEYYNSDVQFFEGNNINFKIFQYT